MQTLLGPTLIADAKGTKRVAADKALKDKDLVLLYFSASWCPPCQAFSPRLKDFYNLVSKDSRIEIVYISSDRNVPDFEGYFGKMPWLSLPLADSAPIKGALARQLKITGIPALIVLDVATGHFVTDQARTDVDGWQSKGGSADAATAVVAAWKAVPAVPLAEANLGAAAGGGGLKGLLMTVLKNPAFIFGFLYLVKVDRMARRRDKPNGCDDTYAHKTCTHSHCSSLLHFPVRLA